MPSLQPARNTKEQPRGGAASEFAAAYERLVLGVVEAAEDEVDGAADAANETVARAGEASALGAALSFQVAAYHDANVPKQGTWVGIDQPPRELEERLGLRWPAGDRALGAAGADDTATRWYRRAARLGCALAWVPLADRFLLGDGTRASSRVAFDCLFAAFRAGLRQSALSGMLRAQRLAGSRPATLLQAELVSVISAMREQAAADPAAPPAAAAPAAAAAAGAAAAAAAAVAAAAASAAGPCGAQRVEEQAIALQLPNLTGLVLAVAGDRLCGDQGDSLSRFVRGERRALAELQRARGARRWGVVYGRRGAFGKQQQQQLSTEASRLCNVRLTLGFPSGEPFELDAGQLEALDAEYSMLMVRGVRVACAHQRQEHLEPCVPCAAEGRDRRWAAAHGLYAVEEGEHGDSRTVLYLAPPPASSPPGTLPEPRLEACKPYSTWDLADVLPALRLGPDPVAHPYFLSQDPNLWWPVMAGFGSLAAAAAAVSVDDSAPAAAAAADPSSAAAQAPPFKPFTAELLRVRVVNPDAVVLKCGSGSCCALFGPAPAPQGMACSRCKVRMYCSRECQKADFTRHRGDCAAHDAARQPPAPPAQQQQQQQQQQ
jgi:hypothetical protein